jgi:AraC-like DNA-binding protein
MTARSGLNDSEDMSVAPLRAIPSLLRELGVEPVSVLGRFGIEERTLGDGNNRLAFDTVGRLLNDCAGATECPHFGLLLGIRSGPASVGIASELMRHAESVGAGLRLLIAHLHLHDRGGVAALSSRGATDMEMSYALQHPNTPGAVHILDGSIAIICSIMRHLCNPQWTPSEVTFSHGPPHRLRPYRSFFRAPLRFDAARSAVTFPARYLEQPIAGADPKKRTHLLSLVAELEAARPTTITEQTIRALTRINIAMTPSVANVAAALKIDPRRLRERLAAEGRSVKELVEELRCELARQLLEETRLPIGDVAATLHYSKPGAFSRAFKAWTGKTPRQWRASAARLGRPTTPVPRPRSRHPPR